jgi:anti-sigma-K factor RskA
MSDIHALSGAYAIDALDDVERGRFARHLAECADCQAEVDSLRETAALLPETTVAKPPASLRTSVLDGIDEVRPLPPVVAGPPQSSRRRRVVALVAAAAAFIAIGGIGATVWHPWSDDSSQTPDLSAVDRVLTAPDAETHPDQLSNGGTVTVVRSNSLNQAVVRVRDMAPAGPDRVWQLWLQQDGEMVSAGLMPAGSDNTVLLDGEPASAEAFGITSEPAGGSDKPTRPPVSLIEFDQA